MTQGVVAAGDKRTAEAGAEMLSRGGNAVDAAVAAAFTSFVTEGTVVNIGAGGYGCIVSGGAQVPETVAYDFFNTMPTGTVHPQMDFREILVDFGPETQPFYIGRASTAVPGAPAGLCRMAADWGSLPLSVLLEPAIRFAEEGFAMPPNMAEILGLLEFIYTDTPELTRLFTQDGRLKKAGDQVRFPELAQTLKRFAQQGPDYMYTGEFAQMILADQRANGGLMLAEDLSGYQALRLDPIQVDYRGHQVLLPPPSSHGGVLIAMSLELLASQDFSGLSWDNPHYQRVLAHTMRITNLAREEWDHMPEHHDRVAHFLSREHIGRRRDQLADALAGAPLDESGDGKTDFGDTSHISAMDAGGLAVSITISAGESAGYLVGNSGVCLNNILGEHDLNPHGFHKHKPGARLHSMMSPAVIMRDGRPVLTVGSAGSNRLRTAIVQTISRCLDFQMPVGEAVNQPRIHYEDGVLQVEGGVPETCIAAFREAGFKLNLWDRMNLFFGGAQAVRFDGERLEGAGDPRRHGAVAEA